MAPPDLREALAAVGVAHRYREWLVSEIRRFLGHRILDVGSGLGDFGQLLAESEEGFREVILSDASSEMFLALRNRFLNDLKFQVIPLDVTDTLACESLGKSKQIDTITCLNVLEHIEDERHALMNMRRALVPGGRLVLIVPALGWLYGSLDRLAGHYRRYSSKGAVEALQSAGWGVLGLKYFNFLGIASWFIGGKLLRLRRMNGRTCGYLDQLVPLISRIERVVPPILGQSLIVIAKNPA